MSYLQKDVSADIPDRPIWTGSVENGPYPGRRLRVLMQGLCADYHGHLIMRYFDPMLSLHTNLEDPTYRDVYKWLHEIPRGRDEYKRLSKIQLSVATWQDASLSPYLQEVADAITTDIYFACKSFDDPDTSYPGVYTDGPPISDEHVSLVIHALQRELNREIRNRWGASPYSDDGEGGMYIDDALPPVPLNQLPFHIQRALVERRRLRYQQWGITEGIRQRGTFSFFDIPEDPDYLPVIFYTWNGGTPPLRKQPPESEGDS